MLESQEKITKLVKRKESTYPTMMCDEILEHVRESNHRHLQKIELKKQLVRE